MGGEIDEDRDRRAHDDVGRVRDPEDRHVEDQVAQRAAADAGDPGQEQEADHIELLARGRERACRGKHRDAGIVEQKDRLHHIPRPPQ